MTEVPPQPQKPRSPEPLSTPTNAATRFLSKWGYKLSATSSGISTIYSGSRSLEEFAKGDVKLGLLWLIPTTLSVITTGMLTVTDRLQQRIRNHK